MCNGHYIKIPTVFLKKLRFIDISISFLHNYLHSNYFLNNLFQQNLINLNQNNKIKLIYTYFISTQFA